MSPTGACRPAFDAAFCEFGLPLSIRSDNGPPFASVGAGGLSQLAVWWIKLGVKPERIEPGKPQQNGRLERLHRTLKAETANPPAATLAKQQRRFDDFRAIYNYERPHEALDFATPASLYRGSNRAYPRPLREPDYPDGAAVRRVRSNGVIKWAGDLVFVSETLIGEPVAVEETEEGEWLVRYAHVELGFIDPSAGCAGANCEASAHLWTCGQRGALPTGSTGPETTATTGHVSGQKVSTMYPVQSVNDHSGCTRSRSLEHRGQSAGAAGEDRSGRFRPHHARLPRLPSRRAAGLLHRTSADLRGGGRQAPEPRTRAPSQRAHRAHQPHQGAPARARDPRRQAACARLPRRLKDLRTGDGRTLPPRLAAEIAREHERLVVVDRQIAAIEAQSKAQCQRAAPGSSTAKIVQLAKLKGLGITDGRVLVKEVFYRRFDNRRQVGACVGLTGTPYDSGKEERDQGISKAGNRRARTAAIELAWRWTPWQPDSELTRWFKARVGDGKGRVRRIAIVALARKLMVALWRYLETGVVPTGAVLSPSSDRRAMPPADVTKDRRVTVLIQGLAPLSQMGPVSRGPRLRRCMKD